MTAVMKPLAPRNRLRSGPLLALQDVDPIVLPGALAIARAANCIDALRALEAVPPRVRPRVVEHVALRSTVQSETVAELVKFVGYKCMAASLGRVRAISLCKVYGAPHPDLEQLSA